MIWFSYSKSRSPSSSSSFSHRAKPKLSRSNTTDDRLPSPENTVLCLRSSDSSSTNHRNSRRHPNPLPRRSTTQTTPADYVNKLANLFSKSFSTPATSMSSSTQSTVAPNEHNISTQTYESFASSPSTHFNISHMPTSGTNDDIRRTFKEHV